MKKKKCWLWFHDWGEWSLHPYEVSSILDKCPRQVTLQERECKQCKIIVTKRL